jgi:hypothetical protein
MKQLTLIVFLFITLTGKAQSEKSSLSSGEKLGLKLQALAKENDIKHISVYFHVSATWLSDLRVDDLNKTSVASHLIDEYADFKFDGQFIVFSDPNDKDIIRYYNLEKLVHFTIVKGKNIRMYFVM